MRQRRQIHRKNAMTVRHKKKGKDAKQDREIAHLKKMVGHPEIKYTDSNIAGGAGAALTVAGQIAYLNIMAQGDQPYNRSGNQIHNIYCRIRGYITLGVTELVDRQVRLQVGWDKAPSGNAAVVYGNTSGGVVAINDNNATTGLIPNVFAPPSHETKDRFKMLYDKVKTLKWTADSHAISKFFDLSFHLNRDTRFSNNGSTVASLMTNGIFFTFTVDNVVAVAPVINFNARVFYADV